MDAVRAHTAPPGVRAVSPAHHSKSSTSGSNDLNLPSRSESARARLWIRGAVAHSCGDVGDDTRLENAGGALHRAAHVMLCGRKFIQI